MWSFLLRGTTIFCGALRRGRIECRNLNFEICKFREVQEAVGIARRGLGLFFFWFFKGYADLFI
jgi:hypothetical protein